MIDYKEFLPPSLVTINKITYIVPGWIVVPNGTTISDINHIKPQIDPWVIFKEVKALRGGGKFLIEKRGTKYRCSCSQFRPTKYCKHIKDSVNE